MTQPRDLVVDAEPNLAEQVRSQERRAAFLHEVVAALCHDLRGPLNAIHGWSAFLRNSNPELSARAIEVVERNVRLQAWLLEDVTEVYRIAGGVTLAQREPVDVAALAEAVVAQARQSLRTDVTFARTGDAPLLVLGDPDVLRTGLRAIVTQLGRAQESRTQLAVSLEDRDVVLRITSTKPGEFPFEGLAALLAGGDPAGAFTRGAGLALLVAHHAAAAHGGSVRAHPEGIVVSLPGE